MKEFHDIADEDLIQMYKRGVKTVDNVLIKRYSKLIYNKSRGYFMDGLESDDLFQEGMIGFYKAIITYKGYENVPFCVFATICINRQLITVIKKAQAGKHSLLNNSVSIDANLQNDSDNIRIIDILAIPREYEPENRFISNESIRTLIKVAKENLSELEFRILKGYLQAKSYAEIAEEINTSTKTVDNALQRIKRKLVQSLESIDYSFN
ncbi:MAG: sigma-70 family RNA polymerase sigma factor [Eubacteriaceae bacterium]